MDLKIDLNLIVFDNKLNHMKIKELSVLILSYANKRIAKINNNFKWQYFYLNDNEIRFIRSIPKYDTLTPKQLWWFNKILDKFKRHTYDNQQLYNKILKLSK